MAEPLDQELEVLVIHPAGRRELRELFQGRRLVYEVLPALPEVACDVLLDPGDDLDGGADVGLLDQSVRTPLARFATVTKTDKDEPGTFTRLMSGNPILPNPRIR